NNCTAYSYTASANLATSTPGLSPQACNPGAGAGTVTNVYEGEGATCGAPAHRGRLCTSTDARGGLTSYRYDGAGNLIAVTPPVPLGATSRTPDGLSRTYATVDGKGGRSRYYYDPMDRIKTITYGGDDSCTNIATCIGFDYDGDGNLRGRSDVSGYSGFVYDAVGRLTEKWPTGPANKCPGCPGTHYTYDEVGNLATYCDAGGTVTYRYDADNDVTTVAEPGATASTTYSYTPDHQRASTAYPGGVRQDFGYDASGRVASVTTAGPHGPYPSFSYCYHLNDDCGPTPSASTDTAVRQKAVEAGVQSHDLRYSYDASNRLTRALDVALPTPRPDWTYAYDANGNRTQSGYTFQPTTYYDYNAADELCLSSTVGHNNCVGHAGSADLTYAYDANGSQLNAPAADRNGSFTYDAKGFTASVRAGATTTAFAYADIDQTERTQAGTTAVSNSALGVAATVAGTTRAGYVRTDTGGLVAQRLGTASAYYLFDGLGSVTGLS
ncbi:MAG: hypothetical protein LC708_03020, partial [Actinobacteria bacterium]|nr:hypothetical protein [Actinomycetota bacterium]